MKPLLFRNRTSRALLASRDSLSIKRTIREETSCKLFSSEWRRERLDVWKSATQSVNGAFVLEEIGPTTPAAARKLASEIGKEKQVRVSLDFRSSPEPEGRRDSL